MARMHTLFSIRNFLCRFLELSSNVKKLTVDPVCFLHCLKATWTSILLFTVGFMRLWSVFPFLVQEKTHGFIRWKAPSDISLSLPQSAHLPECSFNGSSWCAFILMKMVSSPWSIRQRISCMISLMMSASRIPHIEGDLPSPAQCRVLVDAYAVFLKACAYTHVEPELPP